MPLQDMFWGDRYGLVSDPYGRKWEIATTVRKALLVDSMRGRSSTWTRIRINLHRVPEHLRPPQETPDPDDDPTREWRAWRKQRASKKE